MNVANMLDRLAFLLSIVFATVASAQAPIPVADAELRLKEISQFGVTWTFDQPVRAGQFVNGDYWVVGPVNIVGISTVSQERVGTTTLDGFANGGNTPEPRTMNGSMLNPMPAIGGVQGFDSDMYRWHPIAGSKYGTRYKAELNVALGVKPEKPLVLPPDSSLVSSISFENGGRPQIRTAAILTVLAAAPPENGATTFRPPYVGTSKPLYSSKKLRKDLLPNLALVASTPDIKAVSAQFERPWIDHYSHIGDGVQYSSPSDNMPTYGREYSQAVGRAALMLMLDEKVLNEKFKQNKDELLIRFVQLGIDLFHVTENGGFWWGKGGLNHGRKMPIIFAGVMLDNDRMRTIGDRSKEMPYWGFAEDAQTKYIDQADVDMSKSPKWDPDKRAKQLVPYEKADIGMAEWNVGGSAPGLTGPSALNNFFAHPYRDINGMSYPGLVLPAMLLGQKAAWNHDALFDYTDRWVTWAEKENPETNATRRGILIYGGAFQQEMWEAYREKVPAQEAKPAP